MTAVLATEEQQGPGVAVALAHSLDRANDDEVVATSMNGIDFAVDPGDTAGDDG